MIQERIKSQSDYTSALDRNRNEIKERINLLVGLRTQHKQDMAAGVLRCPKCPDGGLMMALNGDCRCFKCGWRWYEVDDSKPHIPRALIVKAREYGEGTCEFPKCGVTFERNSPSQRFCSKHGAYRKRMNSRAREILCR